MESLVIINAFLIFFTEYNSQVYVLESQENLNEMNVLSEQKVEMEII